MNNSIAEDTLGIQVEKTKGKWAGTLYNVTLDTGKRFIMLWLTDCPLALIVGDRKDCYGYLTDGLTPEQLIEQFIYYG